MKELRLAMARLLVEHGSDLNNSDITKDSLLLTAMQYPDDAMISYLINSGVNVHWKQANGATLLHRIAIGNYPASCISKVAGLGVDLEARDNSGYTALHYAVLWAPNIKILRAMVQLPVNLDARNDKGENALHLASETKRSTVTPNLGLHCTYSSQRVRLLVEAGADINARCLSDGATPLHYATGSGATGRVRTLLDLGADTKVKDNAGLTILDTVRKLDLILCPERARIEKLLLDKEGKTRSQPVRRRAEDTNTRITRSVKRARTAKVTRASARAPK
jgi:ankyrin repeat protein